MHRHSDLVQIACRSNLVNSFCSGCIQTDTYRLYKTPTYYAQQLYATLAGDRPLRIDSPLPSSVGPDLSATLLGDGNSVVLFAVNDTVKPIARPLDFSAFDRPGHNGHDVGVWILADSRNAGEPDATNSFGEPMRIVARQTENRLADSPKFLFSFPPLSLTVIRWQPMQKGGAAN
jgi:alpha-L-arabinofuranosidase